jgi:formylglycine-generating enzyme required for sulfatase activity
MMLIFAVPILAAAIYGAVHLRARMETNRRVGMETARAVQISEEIEVLREKADAVRVKAFRQFDAPNVEKGETLWEDYLRIQADLMRLYQRVGQHLETALILDPERARVREMFARHLYDRALLAETRGVSQEAAEHISRLALYDKDGYFSDDWSAPGVVTLSIEPENANVAFFVYTEAEKHRLMAKTIAEPQIRDGHVLLAQGSYLAVIDAPGYVKARFPFVVARNEKTEIAVSLLPESAAPKGFVYIPRGRFLFGSGADEGLRLDFFHAAPIHEVEIEGYFIARYETTFADWLSYLNALGESEQFARRPKVEKGGFQGTLSVARDDTGRWRIAFQPTVKRYEAALGVPIRYKKRDRRTTQNWRRFPVFGISVADAEAYAAWLRKTGRVPGARLCTDMEWERAARGSDGREYPHGHRLEKDDANFDATYDKVPEAMGPDEVGSHPISDSPFGLSDMSGNVWEWTRSSLEPGAYSARGGSYLFGRNSARITDREVTEPSFRDVSVGMRLCADIHAK